MMPLTGFLAVQALALTKCPPWLALESASKVFTAHVRDIPTDQNWMDMALETVAMIREYEANPASHPELARLAPKE